MPNKILNTNMGLGFQRGRKYDTDLDRLGRIETAQGELRKTGELNMQKELRKLKKTMNTYSIRRFSSHPYSVLMTEQELRVFSEILQREFGMGDTIGNAVGTVVDGARDLTGNVVQGAGKVVGSGVGKLTGGYFGSKAGAAAGAALAGPLGAIGGAVLGGVLGYKATGVAGDTIKGIGQDIHT